MKKFIQSSNIEAIFDVKKHAMDPVIKALKPILAKSCFLFSANPPMDAIEIPIADKLLNPHKLQKNV